MGCWNKTCGLSGLHILNGEEVYVFALEKNTGHDRCYSTAFWRPVMLPWTATYNDYGAGEDDQGAMIPFILNGIAEELIEVEQGENQYHDIPVKREGFDMEQFYEAVQEGRLKLDRDGGVEVDFVMMRKDLVDDVLNTWRIRKYVGEGQGTTGWSNAYIEYGFAQILNELPEFMDAFLTKVQDDTWWFADLDRVMNRKQRNLVAEWMRGESSYHYSQILRVGEILRQLIKDGKLDEANEIIVAHLKAQVIDSFMHEIRKAWMPGAYEGSQSQDPTGYRTLHAAVERALVSDGRRYGDDE